MVPVTDRWGGAPVPRSPGPRSTQVRVGLDLGKINDYTALVITEEEYREGVSHFLTRHIERLELGTTYPMVADRVAQRIGDLDTMRRERKAKALPGFSVELVMDTTGIGVAVADLLRERRLRPTLVTLTGSDRVVEHEDGSVSVGKTALVSRLQVLLQAGRLHLPEMPESDILTAELATYAIVVNDHANASFNARSGQHDDLVISLGLSVGFGGPRKHGAPVVMGSARGRW